jgi:hypothetical protein
MFRRPAARTLPAYLAIRLRTGVLSDTRSLAGMRRKRFVAAFMHSGEKTRLASRPCTFAAASCLLNSPWQGNGSAHV